MTVRTFASAAHYRGDGKRQIFAFEVDGEPIDHEHEDEIHVFIDGKELKVLADYCISHDASKAIVTMLAAPSVGAHVDIERHTPLLQLKRFRKSGDWSIDAVEQALDRLTRAVQDAMYRIERIEKRVMIEHRSTGPVEASQIPGLVAVLDERIASTVSKPVETSRLASTVAGVVLEEMTTMVEQNQRDVLFRISRLEDQMSALQRATEAQPS